MLQVDLDRFPLVRLVSAQERHDVTDGHDGQHGHLEARLELFERGAVALALFLPIDGDVRGRLVVDRPMTSRPRTRFTYYPGLSPIPQPATPKIVNRPHSIEIGRAHV